MKTRTAVAVSLGVGLLLALLTVRWGDLRVPGLSSLLRKDAALMSEQLAAQLPTAGPAVGAVSVHDDELLLPDLRLRLTVSTPDGSGGGPEVAHFHVLARQEAATAAGLDACVVGVGADRAGRISSAASAYVRLAFPPILSSLKGDGLLAARPFHGTETWGVPGHRGFVGPAGTRGARVDVDVDQAPLFANLPGLPSDGRPHLLKVVLQAKDGAWRRTVELDGGDTALAKDERWTGLPPPEGSTAIVRFAVFDREDALESRQARADAMKRLAAAPAWLFPAGACPGDVMPKGFSDRGYSEQACRGGRLLSCVEECERGGAVSCYAAALEVQRADEASPAGEALFLRACRLGHASGCTNAAAGRPQVNGRYDACSVDTFERVCELSSDPWACTMIGAELVRGGGVRERDPGRARSVLARSCRYGTDDPACAAATSLLAELARLEPDRGAAR